MINLSENMQTSQSDKMAATGCCFSIPGFPSKTKEFQFWEIRLAQGKTCTNLSQN